MIMPEQQTPEGLQPPKGFGVGVLEKLRSLRSTISLKKSEAPLPVPVAPEASDVPNWLQPAPSSESPYAQPVYDEARPEAVPNWMESSQLPPVPSETEDLEPRDVTQRDLDELFPPSQAASDLPMPEAPLPTSAPEPARVNPFDKYMGRELPLPSAPVSQSEAAAPPPPEELPVPPSDETLSEMKSTGKGRRHEGQLKSTGQVLKELAGGLGQRVQEGWARANEEMDKIDAKLQAASERGVWGRANKFIDRVLMGGEQPAETEEEQGEWDKNQQAVGAAEVEQEEQRQTADEWIKARMDEQRRRQAALDVWRDAFPPEAGATVLPVETVEQTEAEELPDWLNFLNESGRNGLRAEAVELSRAVAELPPAAPELEPGTPIPPTPEETRLAEVTAQAEARKTQYDQLKAEMLDQNKAELLVAGVLGRDADGNRSVVGMIEDARTVVKHELDRAVKQGITARGGIAEAQQFEAQLKGKLAAEEAQRLEALIVDAQGHFKIPLFQRELEAVTLELGNTTQRLEAYQKMPKRLQETHAEEIAVARAKEARFAAEKQSIERTIVHLEREATEFVEAQTPEIEIWHKAELLRVWKEVNNFVTLQEGYTAEDVAAAASLELDVIVHEAEIALENLDKWAALATNPEEVAGQIAEVQVQEDLAVGRAEADVAQFNQQITELKETVKVQKASKLAQKRLEVAKIEKRDAVRALNKARQHRTLAVNDIREQVLPAELLPQEGVNYGGRMAVVPLEGNPDTIELVDIVKANRTKRKAGFTEDRLGHFSTTAPVEGETEKVARTEAITPAGRLAEFAVWGGDAMEPNEQGQLTTMKVQGIYEREAMKFTGFLEATVQQTRERAERQERGEIVDVNESLKTALEIADQGAGKSAELLVRAATEGKLTGINPENRASMKNHVGSLRNELVERAKPVIIALRSSEKNNETLSNAKALADALTALTEIAETRLPGIEDMATTLRHPEGLTPAEVARKEDDQRSSQASAEAIRFLSNLPQSVTPTPQFTPAVSAESEAAVPALPVEVAAPVDVATEAQEALKEVRKIDYVDTHVQDARAAEYAVRNMGDPDADGFIVDGHAIETQLKELSGQTDEEQRKKNFLADIFSLAGGRGPLGETPEEKNVRLGRLKNALLSGSPEALGAFGGFMDAVIGAIVGATAESLSSR